MATQTSPASAKRLVKPQQLTPVQTDGEADSNVERVDESSLVEVRHFSTAETLTTTRKVDCGTAEVRNASEPQQ